jgi:hypothetical protein
MLLLMGARTALAFWTWPILGPACCQRTLADPGVTYRRFDSIEADSDICVAT